MGAKQVDGMLRTQFEDNKVIIQLLLVEDIIPTNRDSEIWSWFPMWFIWSGKERNISLENGSATFFSLSTNIIQWKAREIQDWWESKMSSCTLQMLKSFQPHEASLNWAEDHLFCTAWDIFVTRSSGIRLGLEQGIVLWRKVNSFLNFTQVFGHCHLSFTEKISGWACG